MFSNCVPGLVIRIAETSIGRAGTEPTQARPIGHPQLSRIQRKCRAVAEGEPSTSLSFVTKVTESDLPDLNP